MRQYLNVLFDSAFSALRTYTLLAGHSNCIITCSFVPAMFSGLQVTRGLALLQIPENDDGDLVRKTPKGFVFG